MATRKGVLRTLVVAGAGTAAALSGAAVAQAQPHHLRLIAGLATSDATASWWNLGDYTTFHSTNCIPPAPGAWWHCDDGAGFPALDLHKGDGTVWDASGGCPADQTVIVPDGYAGAGESRCGTQVYFQAYQDGTAASLVGVITVHPSASDPKCSGDEVTLYTPENYHPPTNGASLARLEFVHIDERATESNSVFIIQGGWTIYYLGRAKYPDCGATGPHMHQSASPEGSVVTKNVGLTSSCVNYQPCYWSPAGDWANKWMQDIYWTTIDPTPTAQPTPTWTPIPCCGGGPGGGK